MTTITNSALTPSAASFEELLDKMMPHFRYFAERTFKRKDIDSDSDDIIQDLCGMALETYRFLFYVLA